MATEPAARRAAGDRLRERVRSGTGRRELPRTAGLAGTAGGFAQPDSVPGVIEWSFRSRLELLLLLSPAARLPVTVAAADPIGEAGLRPHSHG
ncbi:hypothetical protein ABZ557_18460 [Streptomyces sp. NPDC019645]|uniref:hypothetical protein n=1 Tax=Streptomyces sp. NPDC019645 TaxID=3154786 RepID=UPI0033F03678